MIVGRKGIVKSDDSTKIIIRDERHSNINNAKTCKTCLLQNALAIWLQDL